MKPKNLRTLELLVVFLTIKVLLPQLKAYSWIKIGDIVISVDAQGVFSWFWSDNIKTNNQFEKNKLEDIDQMIWELKKDECNSKASEQNVIIFIPTKVKKSTRVSKKMNLFIDLRWMIQTKDRISKSTTYEDEIINPVLLAKNHN